ncbi:unnamed protein product, partial [Didymodactylos carnosus]
NNQTTAPVPSSPVWTSSNQLSTLDKQISDDHTQSESPIIQNSVLVMNPRTSASLKGSKRIKIIQPSKFLSVTVPPMIKLKTLNREAEELTKGVLSVSAPQQSKAVAEYATELVYFKNGQIGNLKVTDYLADSPPLNTDGQCQINVIPDLADIFLFSEL